MNKLLIMAAAAVLVGVPLAAQAQDRDDWQGGPDGYTRPAAGQRHDADGRVYRDPRGDMRYRRVEPDRFAGDRSFYRGRDDARLAGGFGVGGGYDGYYPYGDGYAGYPYGGYGADLAYSYPDQYGTYQPFDYDYSPSDDTYYSDPPAYGGGGYGGGAAYGDQGRRDIGWSRGGPPVDCGRWIWRDDRGAYQWVPAPCGRPPDDW